MSYGRHGSLNEGDLSARHRKLRLGVKLALMGAGSVLITATALVSIAIWQSGQYNRHAQKEIDILINTDLKHISQVIYNLVQAENDAIRIQLKNNLNIAFQVLYDYGIPSLSPEKIKWEITNQLTTETEELSLPKFQVGERVIEKNPVLPIEGTVIKKISELTGETATVFQLINEKGDMLRIATNIKTINQSPAIGTYIPSIDADGMKNPIIVKIMMGETYYGRDYIENEWHFTAYRPLYDSRDKLIGMLSVSIKQKSVESRVRRAILQTSVGKTGYVYVLEGSGKNKGSYIISHKGERDGENVWATRDSDGRFVIQEIINKAKVLKPGEMETIPYRWQNPGETSPRWKIANLMYFSPWDWVIGTSVYEDELQTYSTWLNDGRRTMVNIMGIAGIMITLVVVILSILMTLKIIRPVKEMTKVAQKIMKGDLDQSIKAGSNDEIGILAGTFNLMTGKLKESMDNLSESEEKYRGIFQNAIEGLFQNKPEGTIQNANPAMARILGYDSPEDLMKTVKDVKSQLYVNPEERDILIRTLNDRGEIFEHEVQLFKKDGQKIWVSISARLRHSFSGEPELIEGFLTNISARKQVEEALAESRNYLDEIINAVGDPVYVKDDRFRFVLVNNAMCEFINQPRNNILGKTGFDFYVRKEAEYFQASDKKVLESGEESINEGIFTDRDNNIHVILTKKTLYIDKNSKKFIVGILRDITDQKMSEEEKIRLEARLTQSQKMEAIGTLAGGIAHDFNNILSVIIGYTELAMHDVDPDNKAMSSLSEVLIAGERARNLVKQILTFSRMSESEYKPVRVDRVMSDTLRMLRAAIPSNIEIRQAINISGYVLSNSTQISQIIINLCSNAVHSMDASGGILDVSLDRISVEGPDNPYGIEASDGKYLRIKISDTGKGMPKGIRERIFEPYFNTSETGTSAGLGLSVIHGIVKSHHGDIICTANDNGGTTFEIYLPEEENIEVKEDTPPKNEIKTGSGKILVIDDDPVLVNLVVEMLEIMGYEAVSSVSSKEGLRIFKEDPKDFDLVITDMTMPEITGDILAKEIISVRSNTPIILCTGFNEHISKAQAKDIGISEFIMKPVNMKILSDAIHRVINKS